MSSNGHLPVEAAPAGGRYDELNVFGAPTGVVIDIVAGGRLPPLPRGFSWRFAKRPRISELSPTDLLARATEHRQMAMTATSAEVQDALLRIANRLSDMAQERDTDH